MICLGLTGALRRTLCSTNPIESALSVTQRVTARVTRWRDGDMRRRWCVAGLLRAESKFRRVKGHRAMPVLLKFWILWSGSQRLVTDVRWRENGRRNRLPFQLWEGHAPRLTGRRKHKIRVISGV